jgi:predicted DNA-binding protein (MmcQ/YjbR family)
MKKICLSLPDTKLTMTWDKPHFRVGAKIFAGCGEENGKLSIGFKLEMEHADEILRDPRFERAPYVGHKGWVSMDAGGIKDWEEVRTLILESYRLIAPKRTLAKLQEAPPAKPRATSSSGGGRRPPSSRRPRRR